jgi:HAD superfamily hydrolase (TIGR01484 family)
MDNGAMPATPPLPLADLPAARLAGVTGVLTDIDDTLTRDGAIEPQALAALQRLHAAGLPVVAITGRPMGWSEPFARAWPVAAIVAENGAVALYRDAQGRLHTEYAQDEATRARHAVRLREVAARVLREVPGAMLARDSAGRVTDIAVDHAEFARLDDARIAQVVALMHAEGMCATVSSIHINGWFGTHDKWSGARWIVQRLLGRALEDEVARWVYVGDSTNDQLMFRHFPLSVGVANLMHFAAQLQDWPGWITPGERGLGFAELAERLLAARQTSIASNRVGP